VGGEDGTLGEDATLCHVKRDLSRHAGQCLDQRVKIALPPKTVNIGASEDIAGVDFPKLHDNLFWF